MNSRTADNMELTLEQPAPLAEAKRTRTAKTKAVACSDLLHPPIHVISLGAGVQSSCLSLMAAEGLVTPMPVAAIFADTQAEPASVYEWLAWLEKQLPYPVIRVTKGNLTEMALRIRDKRDGSGQWAKSVLPTFIANPDGSRGLLQRQCTYDYKVLQLVKKALELMREHKTHAVTQWIGISLDEAHRMKQSRDERITHRWPLIEMEMKRHQCLDWMKAHGYPKPPRSACVYCPYHSDAEWRRLRDEEPEEWKRAVKFERDLQAVKAQTDNMRGIPYLHASLVPLEQVNLTTDIENGQGILWGNECEGMCGV